MSNHRVEVGPFSFNFADVILPMGLKVSRVEVKGVGAAVEAKPFALNLVQPGALTAEVAEADLTTFLEKQDIGGLHSISVSAKGGKLHVNAKKTLLVDLKIAAVASLRIVDGRQLWIDVESVDVMGAGAKNLVQSQIDKVNPVLDVADLPVDTTLQTVEVEGGKVVLRGAVSPPNFQ
ncbi:DUF2993 domain-containing protein [bacterium]|nr:MAG: DUF2993 domain-containing protein [bacterium]